MLNYAKPLASLTAHAAHWLLPVASPPIREGAVVVQDGRIAAAGPARQVLANFNGEVRDHGAGAILPGLVNCHTHLELSALAGRIPPQQRFEDWLTAALAAMAVLTPAEIAAGLTQGIAALHQFGTALVGDISNTGLSWPGLRQGPLAYHLFYECLGFNLAQPLNLEAAFPFLGQPEVAAEPWVSSGVHAPYSASPALFEAVRAWNARHGRPQTVHLAESRAEADFLATGDGFFRDLLKQRGRWVKGWRPPRQSPATYLAGLNFLGPRTLAVHGVWLDEADAALLARTHTWLVLCPRANAYTGAGAPPVPRLLEAGVNLALGADSLAGNSDLNLFGEMEWLSRRFPEYPAEVWLRLGTLNGAMALGREEIFGSLAPGKMAAMGFIPLSGSEDFWSELYAAGAAGEFRWLD
jgi:cytosine/adenosine deaminase-related metal-dependent hydrolase